MLSSWCSVRRLRVCFPHYPLRLPSQDTRQTSPTPNHSHFQLGGDSHCRATTNLYWRWSNLRIVAVGAAEFITTPVLTTDLVDCLLLLVSAETSGDQLPKLNLHYPWTDSEGHYPLPLHRPSTSETLDHSRSNLETDYRHLPNCRFHPYSGGPLQ